MKKIVTLAMALILSVLIVGCGGLNMEESNWSGVAPAAPIEASDMITETKVVEIVMQSGKMISAEIYPDVAPISATNFYNLVQENFYSGLIFHRVIPGFMIQGGGMDANETMRQANSIRGEFDSNGVTNDLKHTRGVLSMARTNVKDSATSQFFIMHEDYPSLDGEYAAFGKVIDGLDVVDEIALQARDAMDKPNTAQVIKTIRVKE